ncbi:MAG: nucleotidyltransferase [Victivallaceae bacterium]|nr:nucleotidyltransferase [Victivallaceae bacterium]
MERLLSKLNEAGVRYVVIGGQAMLQEGMPRFTLDWDIFIPPFDEENFSRLNNALVDELDMAVEPLDIKTGEGFVQTFQTSVGVVQFHLSPPGLPRFQIVEDRAVIHEFHGIPVKYLCLDDLLSSKLAVARDKDSDDILFLTTKKENISKRRQ